MLESKSLPSSADSETEQSGSLEQFLHYAGNAFTPIIASIETYETKLANPNTLSEKIKGIIRNYVNHIPTRLRDGCQVAGLEKETFYGERLREILAAVEQLLEEVRDEPSDQSRLFSLDFLNRLTAIYYDMVKRTPQ